MGIAAAACTVLKSQRGDIRGVEMFITLADFDIRWGVQARGSEENKKTMYAMADIDFEVVGRGKNYVFFM